MDIRIEKPVLNRPTPEENIALADKWISDTADKMNMFIQSVNRELKERRETNAADRQD